jgi:hypothetical protein
MHQIAAQATTTKLNQESLAMRARRSQVGGIPRRRLRPSRPRRDRAHPVLPLLWRPHGGDEFPCSAWSESHGDIRRNDPDLHGMTEGPR